MLKEGFVLLICAIALSQAGNRKFLITFLKIIRSLENLKFLNKRKAQSGKFGKKSY